MSLGVVRYLWLLLSYQYQTITRTPLRYPVVALCHGDPAALDLQDWPLHMLQQFIDEVDVEVGQFKALDWVVTELTSLPAFLHPDHQGELCGTALASSFKAVPGKGVGPALLCPSTP